MGDGGRRQKSIVSTQPPPPFTDAERVAVLLIRGRASLPRFDAMLHQRRGFCEALERQELVLQICCRVQVHFKYRVQLKDKNFKLG